MALTKLPKNAFGTGSVDASKIEDGTVQNVELTDATLTSEKFATGTIANASLSNTTITINGTSISLGGSSSVGVDVNWQSVVTADGSTATTASAGNGYMIDTTSAAHTFNLPASATLGDQIAIKDYAGTFASNNLTIGRNGHNIQGVANDSLISTNRASLLLVYVNSTKGWIYAEESNVGNLEGPRFITATGGTITESGDYKIHTFTGDGCFTVTLTGGCRPDDGPSNVDYLVVAGGGGGGSGAPSARGGGGGGAGGYRTSFPTACGTIPISITTYPITVGAGGSAGSAPGSPSIFSTITSSGGGKGAHHPSGCTPGNGDNGGSGGGARDNGGAATGGSGNTPPTSPSQGNNGGNSDLSPGGGSNGNSGGAGGGIGGAGTTATACTQFETSGGSGTPNSISGSPVTYSAGGDGGSRVSAENGVSGGNNTGTGGGAGGGNGAGSGAAGGKGIVIIRYKFQ